MAGAYGVVLLHGYPAGVNSPLLTADAAGTWRLGDLAVHRVGFGAMRLTGDLSGAGGPSDWEQSVAVLRRAAELGVDHIDTAAFYFAPLRSANELINTALAPYPEDLVIATRVGPWRDARGAWQGMARPEQLRGQVEENLRQLGRDHLDLVNLRTLSVSKPAGQPASWSQSWLPPARTARRPRRSGWPGPWRREPTCWRFPAPAASPIWPRT